jgi:glycosyltransferase involved in cell wall biosynthesis
VESSSCHWSAKRSAQKHYDQYDVVKAHLLPEELVPDDPDIPAIYLVRDGRDSLVSVANHRADIVSPGSDFSTNLYEAIVAQQNSYFGGWSHNVTAWLDRATTVIRYEDLIKDQKGVFKRVEQLLQLPKADWDNLPNFKEMKFGNPKYGGKKTNKFFRKGKSGSWKDEMSQEQLELFWHFHGDTMERLGYSRTPALVPQNPLMDSVAIAKMKTSVSKEVKSFSNQKKRSVLIDCNLFFTSADGPLLTNLKELLLGLQDAEKLGDANLKIDLLVKDTVYSIQDFQHIPLFEGASIVPFKRLPLNERGLPSYNFPEYASYAISKFHSFIQFSDLYRTLKQLKLKREAKKTRGRLLNVLNKAEVNYDLIHCMDEYNVPKFEQFNGPVVITVSSVNPKDYPDFSNRENVFFISTSNLVRKKLKENFSINPSNIRDIYLQGDKKKYHMNLHPEKRKTVLKRFKIPNEKFIICDSNHESLENLHAIVDGYLLYQQRTSADDLPLVIIGKRAKKHISRYLDISHTPQIIFTGHIKDHFKHILYSSALTSFNLTPGRALPYEALFCKTPLIFNSETPFEEVLSDCGISVNVKNTKDIADALSYLSADKSLRKRLEANCVLQSRQFSRRKNTYDTLQLYLTSLSMYS